MPLQAVNLNRWLKWEHQVTYQAALVKGMHNNITVSSPGSKTGSSFYQPDRAQQKIPKTG